MEPTSAIPALFGLVIGPIGFVFSLWIATKLWRESNDPGRRVKKHPVELLLTIGYMAFFVWCATLTGRFAVASAQYLF